MVTYSFTCTCSASYVGRTTRRLSQRIKEHKPAWLRTGCLKTLTSAIVAHLAETGHQVDNDSFKVIHRVPPNRPKSVRQRQLAISEAVAIRLLNPSLCAQKRLVKALQLPWPRISMENESGHDLYHTMMTSNVLTHRTTKRSNETQGCDL